MKEVTPKRLTKILSVTPETHAKTFKRKIDENLPDIDALINHLLAKRDKESNKK